MSLQLVVIEAKTPRDFEPAFARVAELGAGALLVGTNPLFTEYREQLVALAARYTVPSPWRRSVRPSNPARQRATAGLGARGFIVCF
jgi:hypothetical protein